MNLDEVGGGAVDHRMESFIRHYVFDKTIYVLGPITSLALMLAFLLLIINAIASYF